MSDDVRSKTYDQENINQVRIDDDSESDAIPETIPLDQQDQKFEIPARVLGDEEATKRYLKTLRRQIQDKKRKEQHVDESEPLPPHVQDLYERSTKQVPKKEHKKVKRVLTKYANTFAKSPTDMGQTTWIRHDIETGDHPPVRQRPRRLRLEQRDEVQKQIKTLQEQGLIRPSTSEWASNVVLVKVLSFLSKSWKIWTQYLVVLLNLV